jgi:Ca-activated chloride channel family protein
MNPLFAKPEYLIIGLAVVVLQGLLFLLAERRAWRRLNSFAESGLLDRLTQSHSRRKLWIKNAFLMAVVLLVFASLARPQWGANWEKAETKGIDVMIALDTSKSMLAEDITPNRMERSKLAILDLLGTVEGDRIGLIAFAGDAFLQCPLTLDYQAFRHTLSAIDTNSIPVGGTNIAAAIDEAESYFEQTENARIMILITDGEDLEASGLQRAREAAANGTRILTVGVGSSEGELIPIRNASGGTDYLRDASGNPVSTRLDDATLRQIADASNGLYAPIGPTGSGLERVYQFCLAQMPEEERSESPQRIPIERFHWPLVLAIILLIAESLLTTRRRLGGSSGNLLLTAAILGSFYFGNPVEAGPAREAYKAFEEGSFEESLTLYRDAVIEEPDDPRLLYNLAVSAYRAGNLDEAISSFESTLRLADLGLQEKAFHNLGNSRIALGFNQLDKQPALALKLWTAAIADFENALDLDDGRGNTRQNLEKIKATIQDHTFTLTTAANPEEAGSVSDGADVFYKIPFEIEAEAFDGWQFTEWTADNIDFIEDPTKAKTVVRLEKDTSVTAQFVKTWDLTVLSEDEAMGTAGTSGTYRADEPVKIKAENNDYFAFKKWMSEGVDIPQKAENQAEAEIMLTSNATVTAIFVPAFKLSVELDPEIAGQAGPSGFFEEYSTVPLQAEPRPGFEWRNWVGDGIADKENQQTEITLTEDRLVIAKMERIWNLVIIPTPEEGGTVEGAGDHPVGSTVDIKASPQEGFTFQGWEGPGVADPASAETTVTVESTEHTLFARFEQDEQDENQDDQEQDQDQQDDQQQEDQEQQDDQDQDQEQEQQDDQDQEQEPEDQEQEQEDQEQEPEDQDQDQDQEQEEEGEEEEQALPPPVTGEMTQEEARQLLNALTEDERFLPAGEREGIRTDTRTGRDW